jgi:MFS-type transporter involved in bile tolerance (Atg22 family)
MSLLFLNSKVASRFAMFQLKDNNVDVLMHFTISLLDFIFGDMRKVCISLKV